MTTTESEEGAIYSPEVFGGMHAHLAKAHGSPMLALRLAVGDSLTTLGFIDQTIYANEDSDPSVTWRNEEVLELLTDIRRILTSEVSPS